MQMQKLTVVLMLSALAAQVCVVGYQVSLTRKPDVDHRPKAVMLSEMSDGEWMSYILDVERRKGTGYVEDKEDERRGYVRTILDTPKGCGCKVGEMDIRIPTERSSGGMCSSIGQVCTACDRVLMITDCDVDRWGLRDKVGI